MIAALLHVEKQPFAGWAREFHFNRCGQSCGCCRYLNGETFGICEMCAVLPQMEAIYNRIWEALPLPPLPRIDKLLYLARCTVGSRRVFSDSVLREIARFAPDTSWATSMRSGTVVAELVRIERGSYEDV